MWITTTYVRQHKLTSAILLFLLCMIFIHLVKPSLFYEEDGSFRPFGVGYRKKTILPIWLVSMLVAIFSYLAILYFIRG